MEDESHTCNTPIKVNILEEKFSVGYRSTYSGWIYEEIQVYQEPNRDHP